MNFSFKLYNKKFDPTQLKKIALELKKLDNKETFIYEDDNQTIRSIFAPHWFDEYLNEFAKSNPMIDEVKKIIGSEVYLHQIHFNYKSAYSGGEFAWHSDYTFWKAHDGMPDTSALSLLFLLDDMTEENGPLVILPGSENLTVEKKSSEWTIKHDLNEKDGIITEDMVRESGLIPHTVLGQAGDVFVMHANMWHTSSCNTSSKDRNILFLCYNSVNNKTTKLDRPNYITLRDFNPL